jgi:hypothetical protein
MFCLIYVFLDMLFFILEVTGKVHERLLAVKESPITSGKKLYDIIVNVTEAENLN